MATKWSVEEDYIVCRFYLEHIDSWRDHMEEVMAKMEQAGFGAREQKSVRMRIQNYEYLHTQNKGLRNSAKQSQQVYQACIQRVNKPVWYSMLNQHIQTTYTADVFGSVDVVLREASGLTHFVYTDPVGPSFRELLFKFIDQRGLKDSEVYKACQVGRDTFAHIRKGDKGVSKKTIMQLCFGIKLSYEEAVELMASAGYAFSNHILLDVIVAYYLKKCHYDIFDVNITLYDNNVELLFVK